MLNFYSFVKSVGGDMNLFTRVLFIILFIFQLSFLTSQDLAQQNTGKTILFLFSYHPGHDWEDDIYTTLLSGMKEQFPGVELRLEYMDSKRHPLKERVPAILTNLQNHSSSGLMLIVAVDDNALQFMAGPGKDLFPGVPLVFCGVNDYPKVQNLLTVPHTGVLSRVNLAETLALAYRLIPGLKKVFVIIDATPTGEGNRHMVEDQTYALRGQLGQLEFYYRGLNDFSTDELIEWSSTLHKDSIILLTSWYRDRLGEYIGEKALIQRLQDSTSVPVFNLLHIRPGVLGGKVTSGTVQANLVIDQIGSILSGKDPSSIPVVERDTSIFVIDQNRMNHWGLKNSRLPDEALFLNSFKEGGSYEITIQLLAASFLVVLILIITLVRQSFLLNKSSLLLSRQKNELFTTLNSIGDGVISTDCQSRVVFMNEIAQDITEWTLEEAAGQPLSLIFPLQNGVSGVSMDNPVQQVLDENQRIELASDTILVNKNGLKIHIADSASPIHDPKDNTLLGVIIVFRDITDSDEVRQILYNEQRRLRDAQAMAMVGNWEYDPEFDSYWFSREVFSLTGIDPYFKEVPESLDVMKIIFTDWKRGHPLPDILKEEDRLIKSLMTIPGREGRLILHIMARMVKNPETGKSIVTGIIQDFSELSQTRAALKVSQEQLRQAARMEAVGKLAGGIAHEFNNLLQIILGYSQLLKEECTQPKILEYVEPILKTSASARNLTRQLLLFSRKENLDMNALSLSHLIQNLIPILRRLLEENIQLESDLQGAEDWVIADKQQIEQVLINLCLNARDAMESGGLLKIGQSIYSSIHSFLGLDGVIPAGDYVHLTIQDSGSGINEQILPEIFDPFYTTKEREKGTGLGLSIVYGIIKQHQGYLSVETDPVKGTCFHIFLPRVDPPDNRNVDMSHKDTIEPVVNTVVYMAEDDPMVRQLTETMLRKNGFIIKSFINGKDLIEALKEKKEGSEKIDFFLLDVIMPEMGGVQAFHNLRSLGYDVPVLFMSGYTEERLKNLSDLRNAALIHKPFTMKDLIAQIQFILNSSP
jgi:two-component system cell cycle sensor histidine kinase/response regulator CckA